MSFKIECNRCKDQEYIAPAEQAGTFQDVAIGSRLEFAINNKVAHLCPKCVDNLKVWLNVK